MHWTNTIENITISKFMKKYEISAKKSKMFFFRKNQKLTNFIWSYNNHFLSYSNVNTIKISSFTQSLHFFILFLNLTIFHNFMTIYLYVIFWFLSFFGSTRRIHIKNQWKVVSDFGGVRVQILPPPLCPGRLQMVITFFLLGFYGHKKFWEDKSIHSVGFQIFFGSLSVSQPSLSVSGQKVHFLL